VEVVYFHYLILIQCISNKTLFNNCKGLQLQKQNAFDGNKQSRDPRALFPEMDTLFCLIRRYSRGFQERCNAVPFGDSRRVTLQSKDGTWPGTWAKLVPARISKYRFLCLEALPECEQFDKSLCFSRFSFVYINILWANKLPLSVNLKLLL
jgi:hypothetical protein